MADQTHTLAPVEEGDALADYIRDQVCCPRIHGCELGGADECPAERVRAALAARLPETPEAGPRPTEGVGKLVEALKAADEALAQFTAFEDDARYIMGNTNFAIVQQRREQVRAALAAAEAASPVLLEGDLGGSSSASVPAGLRPTDAPSAAGGEG